MRNIFISVVVLFSFSLLSQTTITNGFLPSAGTVYESYVDSLALNLWVDSGGSNKVWDYSTDFSTHLVIVDTFKDAQLSSNAGHYPQADLFYNTTGWEFFFSSNSNGLYLDGLYAGSMLTLDYNPNELLLPTPITYLNSVNDTSRIEISMGGMATTISYKVKTITADAYGSITTPNGIYNDVLRLKTIHNVIDSSLMNFGGTAVVVSVTNSQYVEYDWVQNNSQMRVMNISFDTLGNIDQGIYYGHQQLFTSIIPEPEKNSFIYPNPAKNTINVSLKEGQRFNLYNILGSKVLDVEYSLGSVIDIKQLERGLYIYDIIDIYGHKISNGKLLIE
tara:strand:- start:133 stop:1131 length:999 start_codon:yes stop_codon:yes gene_type:complete